MPFELIRNDITRMKTDAIVIAANRSLLGGGGVDGAIHRAAGPELLAECRTLGGCETGQAKITKGYRLPAKYVIHTVGPIWRGGSHGEREQLISCYRESLKIAERYGCESVAFPVISAGAYGYPKDEAMQVAVDTIRAFLEHSEMTVYLVVFGHEEFVTGTALFREVREYIDDAYARKHLRPNTESLRASLWQRDAKQALELEQSLMEGIRKDESPDEALAEDSMTAEADFDTCAPSPSLPKGAAQPAPKKESWFRRGRKPRPGAPAAAMPSPNWEDILAKKDEGFAEALLRLIDEKGMTDVECYKKANIDRKLFSKIRSNTGYRPSKATALAFALALELTYPETEAFIRKAGYALTDSSRFDLVVGYFIRKGYYEVFEINMVLFELDLPLLGSGANVA